MNNQPSNTDQHHQLWWLILSMRRAMYKARAKELLQYGITPEETAVLFAANSIGYRATPAEISRWLLREPHSTSGLLSRMEKKGLIRKGKDLDRKNLIRIEITEKGQQAYSQSTKRESIHRIMSSISEEECPKVISCLQRLRDAALEELETAGKTSRPPYPPPK